MLDDIVMAHTATTGIKSYWWGYLCPWYHCCGSCRHVKEYLLKYLVIFSKRRRNKLGCLKYKGAFVTGWYGSPATDPRFATEYCESSPFLVLCAIFLPQNIVSLSQFHLFQRIMWVLFSHRILWHFTIPGFICEVPVTWHKLLFIALSVSLLPITLMKISCEPFKTVFMSYWSSFLITLYL